MLFAFIITGLGINKISAQNIATPVIIIRNQKVYPAQTARQWIDSIKRKSDIQQPLQVVLQLDAAINDKEILAQNGIIIREYLSPATCIATIAHPGKMNAAASARRIWSTLAGSVTLSLSAIGTDVCLRSHAASESGSAGIGCSKYSKS